MSDWSITTPLFYFKGIDAFLEGGKVHFLLRCIPCKSDTDDFVILNGKVRSSSDVFSWSIADPDRLVAVDRRGAGPGGSVLALILIPNLIDRQSFGAEDVYMYGTVKPIGTPLEGKIEAPLFCVYKFEVIGVLHCEEVGL